KGNFIMWEPVLLIQDNNHFKILIDHDEMELFDHEKSSLLHEKIEKIGYKIIDVQYLLESISAPPWSIEVLVSIIKN
ncbi:unnamed protein product, partial [marine sediment metagenome]